MKTFPTILSVVTIILLCFSGFLCAEDNLVVEGLPGDGKAYWGCNYPLVWTGGALVGNISVKLWTDGGYGDIGYSIYDGEVQHTPYDWYPLPGLFPACSGCGLFAKDSKNEFRTPMDVVAVSTPPVSCAIYDRTTTFTFSTSSTTSATSTAVSGSLRKSSSSSSSSTTSVPPATADAGSGMPIQASSSAHLAAPSQTANPVSTTTCQDIDPRVPDNWNCPHDYNCVTIGNASSGLCCDHIAVNCTFAFPLECDLALQNAGTHPDSLVFTRLLDGKLAHCGDGCCPFGTHCHHSSEEQAWHCVYDPEWSSVNKSIAELRGIKAAGDIASVAPEYTDTAHVTAPTAVAALSTEPMPDMDTSSHELGAGPIAGIAVGSFAGVALVAAVAAWKIRRRKKKPTQDDSELEPYGFTCKDSKGVSEGATTAVQRNDEKGEHHLEKDEFEVQSPTLSPATEMDGNPVQSPVYNTYSPMHSSSTEKDGQHGRKPTFHELA